MKKRPLIGLNTLPMEAPRNASFHVRMDFYDKAVAAAGGLPISIPSFAEDELMDSYLNSLDGMLFIGGPDIPPSLYTEDAVHPTVNPLGDATARQHLTLLKRPLPRGCRFSGSAWACRNSAWRTGGN